MFRWPRWAAAHSNERASRTRQRALGARLIDQHADRAADLALQLGTALGTGHFVTTRVDGETVPRRVMRLIDARGLGRSLIARSG